MCALRRRQAELLFKIYHFAQVTPNDTYVYKAPSTLEIVGNRRKGGHQPLISRWPLSSEYLRWRRRYSRQAMRRRRHLCAQAASRPLQGVRRVVLCVMNPRAWRTATRLGVKKNCFIWQVPSCSTAGPNILAVWQIAEQRPRTRPSHSDSNFVLKTLHLRRICPTQSTQGCNIPLKAVSPTPLYYPLIFSPGYIQFGIYDQKLGFEETIQTISSPWEPQYPRLAP